jgi:mRNA-degrading endonuclease RelE of RelBE toxin-antitoxin system
MILDYSKHFLRNYHKAPKEIQQAFDQQSLLLLQNLRHPSLHAKKYDEGQDLW